MQDCEFTVESGRLFCLQTRDGTMTPCGRVQITCDLVREGILDERTAAARVSEDDMSVVLQPSLDVQAIDPSDVLSRAVPTSTGVGIGQLALNVTQAREFRVIGAPYIFAVADVNNEEEAEAVAASAGAIITAAGMISSGAIICRQLRLPCVTSAMDVDVFDEEIATSNARILSGEFVTVDGDQGLVVRGQGRLFYPEPSPEIQLLRKWKEQYGL